MQQQTVGQPNRTSIQQTKQTIHCFVPMLHVVLVIVFLSQELHSICADVIWPITCACELLCLAGAGAAMYTGGAIITVGAGGAYIGAGGAYAGCA
jgi:hypothetical protein